MEVTPELMEEVTRRILLALGQTAPAEAIPRALLLGEGAPPPSLLGQYRFVRPEADGPSPSCEIAVVASLTCGELADLAQGRDGGPLTGPVSRAFLEGVPVLILEEGLPHRKLQATCSPQYYALLEHYVETVRSFGARVCPAAAAGVPDGQPLGQPPVRPQAAVAPPEADGPQVGGLITAEDARRLAGTAHVLRLLPGAVLTPLARDVLREKRVKLLEVGGTC